MEETGCASAWHWAASLPSPLLLVLLLGVAGCAHTDPTWQGLHDREMAPQSVTIPSGGVQIPLTRCEHGHFFVNAQCQGSNLFLALDTGCPRLQLDAAFAREQGIAVFPLEHGTWAEGNSAFAVGLLPELRLGAACATELTAFFTDPGQSSLLATERSLPRPVDGILGGNILRALGVQIDYARNCLWVGARQDENGAEYCSVPLRRGIAPGRLYVQARLPAAKLWLLVDTGSEKSLLDVSVAQRCGIRTVRGTGIEWLSGKHAASETGAIPELQLGAARIEGMVMSFADLSGLAAKETRVARHALDGILGADFFSATNARIDYARPRLRFPTKPRTERMNLPPAEPSDGSGAVQRGTGSLSTAPAGSRR